MHLVYLLRCSDGTLYTGYTTDLPRRLHVHNAGKGAKYTRSRLPVEPVAAWRFPAKGPALAAEYRIRKLPRLRKLALIDGVIPPELGALQAYSPVDPPPSDVPGGEDADSRVCLGSCGVVD